MKGIGPLLRSLGLRGIRRQNTGAARYRNRDGSERYVKFGEAGAADWAGVLPDGRHLELEVKRPGERPRPDQIARLIEANRNGGVGFWIDDVAEAAKVLTKLRDIPGAFVVVDENGDQWVDDGKD